MITELEDDILQEVLDDLDLAHDVIKPTVEKTNFSLQALERIEAIREEYLLGDDFFAAVLLFCQEIDVEVEFFYKKADPIIIKKIKESAINQRKVQKKYYGNENQLKRFFKK